MLLFLLSIDTELPLTTSASQAVASPSFAIHTAMTVPNFTVHTLPVQYASSDGSNR